MIFKWKNLSFLKRTLIIGLCTSLIFVIINTFLLYGLLGVIIFYPINWLLFNFLNLFGLKDCGESCWWILILIGNIEFIISITLLSFLITYWIKIYNKK